MKKQLGMQSGKKHTLDRPLHTASYLNFKLSALGLPNVQNNTQENLETQLLIDAILEDYKRQYEVLSAFDSGINKRINTFLNHYFDQPLTAIKQTLNLDYYGLARELSLPTDGDLYKNDYVTSYRIKQGILNNPKHDKRTTKGSFHIAEGGLPIPADKIAVPKDCFAALYQAAIHPPEELLELPFTSTQTTKAKTFVSLLVRPTVQPKVDDVLDKMSSEVLFIAPGALVSNLDFVESVFGNAGNPQDIENDAGFDYLGFTGHTGYVILAPHLTKCTKKSLGLPHYDDATEKQRLSNLCYTKEDELYNDGLPFKITARDKSGVAVTLIGDNYYGYSKKEIKTQIGFASNLLGGTEEEHAGGTIAFTRVNLGEHYYAIRDKQLIGYTFEDVKKNYGQLMHLRDENYGVDKNYDHIIYLPENVVIDLLDTSIRWDYNQTSQSLKLKPSYSYILPNGDKIHIEKHPAAPAWKLVKTEAEGLVCHKPCTVSGGGKSEISKALDNGIIYGSYYVDDLDKALDSVQKILDYDYTNRWRVPTGKPARTILSVERTLGSVIKLLTPSTKFTEEYNAYISSIPTHIKALVFLVKRFYKPEWKNHWKNHFTVDEINGTKGHEINYNNRKIRPSYLRVGFNPDDTWRTFKLRMDFMPAEKLQTEDDISATVTVNTNQLTHLNPMQKNASVKFTDNCEYRFFQRPDDAIHKGYDKHAEKDLAGKNLFITNFEPIDKNGAQIIKDDIMGYTTYSSAMQKNINDFLKGNDTYCVISSEPRIVNEAPSKNPRYLENRSDIIKPIRRHIADIGVRLNRRVPMDKPVYMPVGANLPGRRNNPADELNGKRIRPLSVYNPLHYQPLPELFMDYISSLTGKSPSTTGAGSEGALTKAPFNMLLPIYDLNSALLSYILSDYNAFSTPAGFIGNQFKIDHDITMLIPEIWARLSEQERDPDYLIKIGALEKVNNFEHQGKTIPASRLGYRMTEIFARQFMGKVFDEPQSVFTKQALQPETQNLDDFVDGILNIAESHKKVAQSYFIDGSIDEAIEPLKALLHIMAEKEYKNYTLESSEFRALFTRDNVINSDWYSKRLQNKQRIDIHRLNHQVQYIQSFLDSPMGVHYNKYNDYTNKLSSAKARLKYLQSNTYYQTLIGTIGAESFTL